MGFASTPENKGGHESVDNKDDREHEDDKDKVGFASRPETKTESDSEEV